MATRTRAPAHMNVFGFKHNPGSKKTAAIAAIPNSRVCKRCHDIIEWRKKYRKYKPLTKPGKCIGCTQRRVKFAYHQLCGDCAHAKGVCAKCMEKEAVADEGAVKEALLKEIEFLEGTKGAIPGLSERERRTLLRETYRKAQAEGFEVEDLSEKRQPGDDEDEADGEAGPGRKHGRIPRAPGAAAADDDVDDDGAEAEYAADSMHALSSQDEAEIAMLRAALKVAKARATAMDSGRKGASAAAGIEEAEGDAAEAEAADDEDAAAGPDDDDDEEHDGDEEAGDDEEDEEEAALDRRIPVAGVVTSSSAAPAAHGYARLLAAVMPEAVIESQAAVSSAVAPADVAALPLHERISRLVVEPRRPTASAAASTTTAAAEATEAVVADAPEKGT